MSTLIIPINAEACCVAGVRGAGFTLIAAKPSETLLAGAEFVDTAAGR
jgi:hypothetical protein